MRILVTGGAGYIGSHTSKLLAASGHQPVVFDDLSQGHEWAVKWGPLERGSLADRARLAEVFAAHRIDAVVHFAANALVGESMTNPTKYFRNNTVGTLNLLEAMHAAFHGVHPIILVLDNEGYGTQRPMLDGPFNEIPQLRAEQRAGFFLLAVLIISWYSFNVHNIEEGSHEKDHRDPRPGHCSAVRRSRHRHHRPRLRQH